MDSQGLFFSAGPGEPGTACGSVESLRRMGEELGRWLRSELASLEREGFHLSELDPHDGWEWGFWVWRWKGFWMWRRKQSIWVDLGPAHEPTPEAPYEWLLYADQVEPRQGRERDWRDSFEQLRVWGAVESALSSRSDIQVLGNAMGE